VSDVEFKSNAKEILSAEEKAVKVALTKIGMIVERDTKAETPVDTGNLRNSFTNDVRASEKAVYIGSNVEYAPYIEYGHRYGTSGNFYAGKHMLQNAINNNQKTIKNIIEQELGK
jgi:HK97 gp10 family phage protein